MQGWCRGLTCVVLATLAVEFFSPQVVAQNSSDMWRRTVDGWEQKEDWDRPIFAANPVPELSLRTAPRRCWPAAFAAAQMLLAMAILNSRATRKEQQ